jgi:hypothetical protein
VIDIRELGRWSNGVLEYWKELECWSAGVLGKTGVLEYWSTGKRQLTCRFVFHHSIAPLLQYPGF